HYYCGSYRSGSTFVF
nr:immunoglobulin light chain junction region [Macaca mulatta]